MSASFDTFCANLYDTYRYFCTLYGGPEKYILAPEPNVGNDYFIKTYSMNPEDDGGGGERDTEYVDNEIVCLKFAGSNGISPRFIADGYCVNGRYIIMEKVEGHTLRTILGEYIRSPEYVPNRESFETFCVFHIIPLLPYFLQMRKSISCWDVALYNIMYGSTISYPSTRYWIIDFGNAFPEESENSVSDIVRTLMMCINNEGRFGLTYNQIKDICDEIIVNATINPDEYYVPSYTDEEISKIDVPEFIHH